LSQREQTSVQEPLVLGELLSGGEALLVLAGPLYILVFCVVHTVQVQEVARTLRPILASDETLNVWEIITDLWLIAISGVFSLAITLALILVTAIGVVIWRFADWMISRSASSRSRRRYQALAGDDVVEADAWSRDLPEPEPAGYEREPVPTDLPRRPGRERAEGGDAPDEPTEPGAGPVDWTAERPTWERWTRLTRAYVAAINAWAAQGQEQGWEAAGEQPEDPRDEALATAVLELVERANAHGQQARVRAHLATAHAPFVPWLERGTRPARGGTFLDADRVAVTLGEPWSPHAQVHLFSRDGSVTPVPHARLVGRRGRWWARWTGQALELRDGFDGPVERLPHPRGSEGAPERAELDPDDMHVQAVEPLPDGSGVLLTASTGVFVCRDSGVQRLYPTADWFQEQLQDWPADESFPLRFDMIHAALSPDGALVACGSQDGPHLLVDLHGRDLGHFGPVHSSYPHHAAFSPRGQLALFNSCHLYSGVTVAVDVASLRGMRVEPYQQDPRVRVLQEGARVYCSAWLDDQTVLLGDAHGYVHAVSRDGEDRGKHFVGSTVNGLAVAPDGRTVVVATHAGFVSFVDTQPAEGADPAVIGTAGWRERRRFVAWPDRDVLVW